MSLHLLSRLSVISTSTRLTSKTVASPNLPSTAAFLARANTFGKSADGVPRTSAMVGLPPRPSWPHLRASDTERGSAGHANKEMSMAASLGSHQEMIRQ